jgi:hypothetical protein
MPAQASCNPFQRAARTLCHRRIQEEQNVIIRGAVACNTLAIYRTMVNPALTDISIHPNKREILGVMQPDPQVANWSIPGFVQMMTVEGWLST